MDTAYELKFIEALALTTVIELPAAIMMVRIVWRMNPGRLPWSRLIGAGLFSSFATIPYLWFVLPFWLHSRMPYIIIGEVSVIVVEAIFYCLFLPLSIGRGIFLSFCCNAASFLSGLLLFQ